MDSTDQTKDYFDNPNTYSASRPKWALANDRHVLARGLGWFSIVLGAAELWKSKELSRTLGTAGEGRIYQLYGVREIGTGIGLLTAKDPAPWVWARVAGDLLDIATLAPGLRAGHEQRKAAAVATAFVAGAALADLACAVGETQQSRRQKQQMLPPDYHPELGQ